MSEPIPFCAIYELDVTLLEIDPPVSRQLRVSSRIHLSTLHIALQIAMGWSNCHQHLFNHRNQRYGVPGEDNNTGAPEIFDEENFRLCQLIKHPGDSLIYEYDFNDGWLHDIVLRRELPYDRGVTLPACIGGVRACPPEDVGGPAGYSVFVEALSNPQHPEYQITREWVGGEFDADEFNIATINEMLKEYCA